MAQPAPVPLPSQKDELLLLHNPGCSKSRATQALLEQRKVHFQVRLYLDEPLGLDELRELRSRLDRPVSEWVRSGEAEFAEAGLSKQAGDDALLEAIARAPRLLERPILVNAQHAVVGRPPEDVLALL